MLETSDALFARALKVAPGGVHSPVRAFKSVGGTPVFFRSASGAHLTSVEGKTYIDFCQSFGPLILGHRDADVASVVHETVDLAWSFGATEPYSLELAEWMTSRLPWVEKLRYVSSGTEAVMSALRVARAATGRNKVLKFDGCYHGHVDSLLVKAGSGLAGDSASDSAGVSASMAAETLVISLDDDQQLQAIFDREGSKIAALILEPLPANYGLLEQRKEFIEKAVQLARRAGALVIFDEVISGFRVAQGGMAQRLCIVPDLVTYGKVIGGGFPVGCYGGRQELMNLVAPLGPVYQAGTLSANPVGMRAGLATLQKVEDQKVYEVLEKRGSRFEQQINHALSQMGLPIKMSRYSSLFWIHEAAGATIRRLEQIPKTHAANFKSFFHACLRRGVYLAPSGYEVGFIGYAHTDAILDEAAHLIIAAAKEVYV